MSNYESLDHMTRYEHQNKSNKIKYRSFTVTIKGFITTEYIFKHRYKNTKTHHLCDDTK